MKIELEVMKVVVLTGCGMDAIVLHVEAPTAFPEMQYAPSLKLEARAGYGAQYCREQFGIEPEVIDVG